MRLSEKRSSALYDAIREPVMDLRLEYTKSQPINADELDLKLFRLEQRIWQGVCKELRLSVS